MICASPILRGPDEGKPATGTRAGWARHYRAGEPICDACVEGRRVEDREHRRENRDAINAAARGRHTADTEWAAERRAKKREWYRNNPEYRARQAVKQRKWAAENPELVRNKFRQYRYGITPDEYQALYDEQGGQCAICGIAGDTFQISVDHDHDTDAIRGLLCRICNTGLGMFRDDPALLRQAITYLTVASTVQRAS